MGLMRACFAALLMLAGGCVAAAPTPTTDAPAPPDYRREALEVLEALEASFEDHWGTLEATAPFRGLTGAHVPALKEVAGANGPQALMALRVLDRLSPAESLPRAARAQVYASALGRETRFARWGAVGPTGFLPGVYGAELLALGTAATDPLRPLLSDRRRASIRAGRAEEAANRLQGDRVCDYAWIFLATIHDRPIGYFSDPVARDEAIRRFDLWLDRRK